MDVMNEEAKKARSKTEGPSVNREVERVVEGLIRDAQALRVEVSQGPLGETRIDCGVRALGVGSRAPHGRNLPRRPWPRVA